MPCYLTHEEQVKGGFASGRARRQKAMAKLAHLTKMQIARLYYQRGWQAGVSCERRRHLDLPDYQKRGAA